MRDPGLRFWLRHVEDHGGLWEPAGDSVLVVLPPELGTRYGLGEELLVTSDPDVAREDGVTFLGAGHPVLAEAAESVLDAGDAGCLLLERPERAQPVDDVLLAQARAQLPVSHGRIDLADRSRRTTRWVIRVGVLASYVVSAEDLFQEQVERWVDVTSRREVPAAVVERLSWAPVAENGHQPRAPFSDLGPALAEAHRLIEADAVRRRVALSRQLGDAHEEERARATAYYADVLAGIERRLENAAPDRRALLQDRLAGTREEQARRLAEIAEKYRAHHEIRPYRLHLVGVPAVRLPVDVRRGDRRYPMELDWLEPAGVFAEPRCPSCASAAPLVAGKNGLGCLACLTPATPQLPTPRTVAPKPATAKPATVKPASAKSATAKPASAKSATARPAPARPAAPSPAAAKRAPAGRATPAGGRAAISSPRAGSPVGARTVPKQAEKLAATVWNAVAARRGGRLRTVVEPGSPAAALCLLYGVDAPRYAIGVPQHEELTGFTARGAWLTENSGLTDGVVQTMTGGYPYVLHWRAEHRMLSVVEILDTWLRANGEFSRGSWWLGGRPHIDRAPADVSDLDGVARALVSVGAPWHGLGVTARALAAWWRLDDADRPDGPPEVLAAAVHRLVASRAGDSGRFRDAAEAYRVDEAKLRQVDASLRRRLGLGPHRAW